MNSDDPSAASTHSVASSGAARHAVPNSTSSRRSWRISPPATDRCARRLVISDLLTPAGDLLTPDRPGRLPARQGRLRQGGLGETGALHGEHLGVAAARRDQLVVAAQLGDPAVVE